MRNVTQIVLSIVFLNCIAVCQSSSTVKKLEHPPHLVRLVSDSRLVPPELTVDTLVSVAELKQIDQKWRMELLEEALRTIDDVKYPVAMAPIQIKGINLQNSPVGVKSTVLRQKLDRLSLKARIIRQILVFDPGWARKIAFLIGGELGLKTLRCEDALAYDVSDLYLAVAEVANKSFTEKEIADGYRFLFLAPWIDNANTLEQLDAVPMLITAVNGTVLEKAQLIDAFSRAMTHNFNDNRSLVYILQNGFFNKIDILSKDPTLKLEIVTSFRSFLVRNFRTVACIDNEIKPSDSTPPYIQKLNAMFGEKPLTLEDISSLEVGGAAKIYEYSQSDFSRQLVSDIRALRGVGSDNTRSIPIERTDLESQMMVTKLTDSILSWKQSSTESDADIFDLQTNIFFSLIADAQEGPFRKTIIRKYMRLLHNSPVQRSDFVTWYYYVNRLNKMYEKHFEELANEFPNNIFALMIERKENGIGVG